MASRVSVVDYLLEQMAGAASVSARKMFGEYGLYCDGKMVALICGDQLFVKPTEAGRVRLGDAATEAPPYSGAKPCFLISGERWDDADWLAGLIRASAADILTPTKKRRTPP